MVSPAQSSRSRFVPWLSPALTSFTLWLGILVRQGQLAAGSWLANCWWLIPAIGAMVAGIYHSAKVAAPKVRSTGAFALPLLIALAMPDGISLKGFFQNSTQLQAQIHSLAIGVSNQSLGLTLGITDGDVTGISKSLAAEFKDLSLAHLTAVSGTNCSIVMLATAGLAASLGLGRRYRVLLGLLALLGYLQLVGNQPSVLRAAVMACCVLLVSLVGRRVQAVNVLALSVSLLLVLQPALATSLGLGLSVAATAGVLLLAPRLGLFFGNFLPRWLALAVAVAIAAQLACLPLLIGIQGSFNLGGVLANLIAEPLVAPATLLGIVGAVMSLLAVCLGPATGIGAVLAGMAKACFWTASVLCEFVIRVAHWLEVNVPSISLPNGGWVLALCLAMLAAAFLVSARGKRPKRLGAALLALVLVLAGTRLVGLLPAPGFPGSGWFMVACDVGQGDATVLRAGGSIAVIDVGRDPTPIDRCLTQLNIHRIDFLQLTHFDLDHVGGLSGAIGGRTVKHAYLTQYPDVRPGAWMVEKLLRQAHIPVTKLAAGSTGVLGNRQSTTALRWLALSPNPLGDGAASANEGSVSIFWTNGQFNIFTMADLPAVGQQRLMQQVPLWWRPEFERLPTVLKVSHHGSADQDPAFLRWAHATIATISVGAGNQYGHPTQKTLRWLRRYALLTLRTDLRGSVSISWDASKHALVWNSSKRG